MTTSEFVISWQFVFGDRITYRELVIQPCETGVNELTSLSYSYGTLAKQVIQTDAVPSLMLLGYSFTNIFKVGVLCILFTFFVFCLKSHGP